MKIITKVCTVLAVALMFSTNVKAQKNYLTDATKAYESKEYFNAIELYKKAYTKAKKKEEKAKIIFMTGECYRMIGDNKQQEQWYIKAIKANYPDPKATLYLANAKKAQEKYNEALIEYKNYQKLNSSDSKGADGAKSCELAQKWKDSPTRYKVENMVQINSKDPDFATCYSDKKYNKLYFTSMRPGGIGNGTDQGLGENYSDIFETSMDKNLKWSTPTSVGSPVCTSDNEGNCAVNKKADMIVFTRCLVDNKKVTNNQLWVSMKKGTSWGDPKKVDFCKDSFKYAAPTLTSDGQTMFFCSNLPGGQGGNDIWVSKYDKKTSKWGDPKNLGANINTSGEEVWPFIHEDGTLYFSSDGHIGMGGLDIFKAEKMGEDKWANVTNMKYPINSAADDFGIIFEGKKERGYLSSNRDGSKGQDDIWSFVMPPMIFTLDGVVKDCDNGEVIPDVVVKLVGSDGSSVETKTDKAGHYLFAENGNDRYILIGNTYTISTLVGKDIVTNEAPFGFFNSSEKPKISTVIEEKGKSFTENFCLKPITKEVRFPRVEYDLGKANLRSESKDSLNFLYQTLIDNPTFVIELSAHTDYRDTDASNLILSEHRADSCVAYLVSKGIPAERMKPKGWGESVPSTLTREMKLPSGKVLPVGTILSEKWIDKEVSAGKNKDDYEYVMQSNRRTVFSVLSKDYVNPNAPKEDPKKKKKTDDDDDE